MELPLQHCTQILAENDLHVSILVLMELPLQLLYTIHIIYNRRFVSILVLMELPLQQAIVRKGGTGLRQFQSLF